MNLRIKTTAVVITLCTAVGGATVSLAGAAHSVFDVESTGVWAVNDEAGSITRLGTGGAEGSVEIPQPVGELSVVETAGVAYASDEAGNVYRIEPGSYEVEVEREFGTGSQFVGRAGRLYVVDGADATVTEVDPEQMSPIGPAVDIGGRPGTAVVGPDGVVWVPNLDTGEVIAVDGDTRVAAEPVTTGDTSGLRLAVVHEDVVAIDAAAGTITTLTGSRRGTQQPLVIDGDFSLPDAVGSGSTLPILAPGGTLIAVDVQSGDRIDVDLSAAGHDLGTPQAAGGRIYIPDQTAGVLLVVDPSTGEIETIALSGEPGQLEVLVKGDRVYVNEPGGTQAWTIGADGTAIADDKYQQGDGPGTAGSTPSIPPAPPPPVQAPTTAPQQQRRNNGGGNRQSSTTSTTTPDNSGGGGNGPSTTVAPIIITFAPTTQPGPTSTTTTSPDGSGGSGPVDTGLPPDGSTVDTGSTDTTDTTDGDTTTSTTPTSTASTTTTTTTSTTLPPTTTTSTTTTSTSTTTTTTIPAVPGAPASVAATGSDGRVDASWPAASSGGPVTGYTATLVDTTSGAVVDTSSGPSLSAAFTGLVNGTAYRVDVRATGPGGAGASRSSAAVTTFGAPGAAGTPTVTQTAQGTVQVSWSAAADNGSAVTGYTVSGAGTSQAGDVASRTSTFSGLAPGAYQFTVVATNGAGSGAASASGSFTVQSWIPDAPAGVAPSSITTASAVISWAAVAESNGVAIDHYAITVSNGASTTAAGGSVTVSGLTANTAYTATVVAVSTAGTQSGGTTVTFTTAAGGGGGGGGGGGCFRRVIDGRPGLCQEQQQQQFTRAGLE